MPSVSESQFTAPRNGPQKYMLEQRQSEREPNQLGIITRHQSCPPLKVKLHIMPPLKASLSHPHTVSARSPHSPSTINGIRGRFVEEGWPLQCCIGRVRATVDRSNTSPTGSQRVLVAHRSNRSLGALASMQPKFSGIRRRNLSRGAVTRRIASPKASNNLPSNIPVEGSISPLPVDPRRLRARLTVLYNPSQFSF